MERRGGSALAFPRNKPCFQGTATAHSRCTRWECFSLVILVEVPFLTLLPDLTLAFWRPGSASTSSCRRSCHGAAESSPLSRVWRAKRRGYMYVLLFFFPQSDYTFRCTKGKHKFVDNCCNSRQLTLSLARATAWSPFCPVSMGLVVLIPPLGGGRSISLSLSVMPAILFGFGISTFAPINGSGLRLQKFHTAPSLVSPIPHLLDSLFVSRCVISHPPPPPSISSESIHQLSPPHLRHRPPALLCLSQNVIRITNSDMNLQCLNTSCLFYTSS